MFEHPPVGVTFADLCGAEPPDEAKPPLDRALPPAAMTPLQQRWRGEGVVVLPRFIPYSLLDAYSEVRARLAAPGGWRCDCPYLHYDEIKDVCLWEPLARTLRMLVGDDMGLHLNLTGWVSTERSWHQDDYLNPPEVNAWYAAVWIALDDIHPDSGPFEYVPGSHLWPLTRRERIFSYLSPEERASPNWPAATQGWVAEAFAGEIDRRGAAVERFMARKGDVLVWHGRLVHRGGTPRVPGMPRKSLIAHYSALSHRSDMPARRQWKGGGWYFDLNVPMAAEERV